MDWVPSVNYGYVMAFGVLCGLVHLNVHGRFGAFQKWTFGIGAWYVVLKVISAMALGILTI